MYFTLISCTLAAFCGLFHYICSFELNLSATESAFTIISHYQPTKGQDPTTFRVYRQPSSVAMHVGTPMFYYADIHHHRVSTYYVHTKAFIVIMNLKWVRFSFFCTQYGKKKMATELDVCSITCSKVSSRHNARSLWSTCIKIDLPLYIWRALFIAPKISGLHTCWAAVVATCQKLD